MAKRNRTHLETICLIEEVKKNPILWDCKHEEYKLAENKPAVWHNVAAEVKCSKGMHYGFVFYLIKLNPYI